MGQPLSARHPSVQGASFLLILGEERGVTTNKEVVIMVTMKDYLYSGSSNLS